MKKKVGNQPDPNDVFFMSANSVNGYNEPIATRKIRRKKKSHDNDKIATENTLKAINHHL